MGQAMMTVLLMPELLELIFALLSRRDMKAVVLVCKQWCIVGSSPEFWSWVELTVTSSNSQIIQQVLPAPRFSCLKCLSLEAVSNSICNSLLHHYGLRRITLSWCTAGLTTVGPRLLAQLLTRAEEANLGGSVLPRQQSALLLEAVAAEPKGTLKLRRLDLSGSFLSHVDPVVLAIAVNKLERVNLADTFITDEQLKQILQQVLSETRLQELHIGGLNQSYSNLFGNRINDQNEHKESELLIQAFNKIKIIL